MKKHIKDRKGFTLVEVIIVLVILAILAAVFIPSLVGYIDKSSDQTVISNGGNAYKAAQILASEKYSKKPWVEPTADEVKELSEVPGEITLMTFSKQGKVDVSSEKPFKYTENGITAVYADKKWTIEQSEPDPEPDGEITTIEQKSAVFAKAINYLIDNNFQGTRIDSCSINNGGPVVTQFYNTLSQNEKDFLDAGTWCVINNVNGLRLYYTLEKAAGSEYKVYKFKLGEGDCYQIDYHASISESGKLTPGNWNSNVWYTPDDLV